ILFDLFSFDEFTNHKCTVLDRWLRLAILCIGFNLLRNRWPLVAVGGFHIVRLFSDELYHVDCIRIEGLDVHKLYDRFGGEFGLFRSRYSIVVLFDLDAFTSHKSTVVTVTVTRWLRLAILGAGFNFLLNLGSLIAVLKHFETPPSMCL